LAFDGPDTRSKKRGGRRLIQIVLAPSLTKCKFEIGAGAYPGRIVCALSLIATWRAMPLRPILSLEIPIPNDNMLDLTRREWARPADAIIAPRGSNSDRMSLPR
jgi:hypothetical protein